MERVKQVIILAAGRGSRLKPYTSNCPKCMLPIPGEGSSIERILRQCKKFGMRPIIVTGYMHECFSKLRKKFDCTILYNEHYMEANNAQSLLCAYTYMNKASMIIDADQIIDDRLFLTNIEQSGYCCSKERKPSKEWAVKTTDDNFITSCKKGHVFPSYVIHSVSYWTGHDIDVLRARLLIFADNWDLNKYWDDTPLFDCAEYFKLRRYKVKRSRIIEFDTVKEYKNLIGCMHK